MSSSTTEQSPPAIAVNTSTNHMLRLITRVNNLVNYPFLILEHSIRFYMSMGGYDHVNYRVLCIAQYFGHPFGTSAFCVMNSDNKTEFCNLDKPHWIILFPKPTDYVCLSTCLHLEIGRAHV